MGTGCQELGNAMPEAESRGKGWAYRLGVFCIQWQVQYIYKGGAAIWLEVGQGHHICTAPYIR